MALRPIDIGETNRTCTGTNAVTGRDAAVTSWSPSNWCSHVDLHHEPSPSHGEMQHSYTLGASKAANDEGRVPNGVVGAADSHGPIRPSNLVIRNSMCPWPDSHRLGSG